MCLQYFFSFMSVIFGETDNWVSMSPKKVLSVSWTNETEIAPLQVAANEIFDVLYILGSKVDTMTCKLQNRIRLKKALKIFIL